MSCTRIMYVCNLYMLIIINRKTWKGFAPRKTLNLFSNCWPISPRSWYCWCRSPAQRTIVVGAAPDHKQPLPTLASTIYHVLLLLLAAAVHMERAAFQCAHATGYEAKHTQGAALVFAMLYASSFLSRACCAMWYCH